jgi:hypothetical protein
MSGASIQLPLYAIMGCKETVYLFWGNVQCLYNTSGGINYIKQSFEGLKIRQCMIFGTNNSPIDLITTTYDVIRFTALTTNLMLF